MKDPASRPVSPEPTWTPSKPSRGVRYWMPSAPLMTIAQEFLRGENKDAQTL